LAATAGAAAPSDASAIAAELPTAPMILRSIEILLGVLANRHGRCRTWLLDE